MGILTVVGSVLSLIISIITIFQIVIRVNGTLVRVSCSIDNLSETLKRTTELQEIQRTEIEALKIAVAKLTK